MKNFFSPTCVKDTNITKLASSDPSSVSTTGKDVQLMEYNSLLVSSWLNGAWPRSLNSFSVTCKVPKLLGRFDKIRLILNEYACLGTLGSLLTADSAHKDGEK